MDSIDLVTHESENITHNELDFPDFGPGKQADGSSKTRTVYAAGAIENQCGASATTNDKYDALTQLFKNAAAGQPSSLRHESKSYQLQWTANAKVMVLKLSDEEMASSRNDSLEKPAKRAAAQHSAGDVANNKRKNSFFKPVPNIYARSAKIHASSRYNQTVTFNKNIELVPWGSTVPSSSKAVRAHVNPAPSRPRKTDGSDNGFDKNSDDDDVSVEENTPLDGKLSILRRPVQPQLSSNKKFNFLYSSRSGQGSSKLPPGASYDKNGYVTYNGSFSRNIRLQAGSVLYEAPSKTLSDASRSRRNLNRKKLAVCNYCQQRVSIGIIREHVLRHMDPQLMPHACHKCEGRFPSHDKLKMHIDISHNHKRNYKCNVCSYLFSCRTNLRVHQNTKAHKDVVAGIAKPKPQVVRQTAPKHLLNSRRLQRCEKITDGPEWTALSKPDDENDGEDDAAINDAVEGSAEQNAAGKKSTKDQNKKPKRGRARRFVYPDNSVSVNLPVKIYRENYCEPCDMYISEMKSHVKLIHAGRTAVDVVAQPLQLWKQIDVNVNVSPLWTNSLTMDAVYASEEASKRRLEDAELQQTKFHYRDIHAGISEDIDLTEPPFNKLNLLASKQKGSPQIKLFKDQWGRALLAIKQLHQRATGVELQLKVAQDMLGPENCKILASLCAQQMEQQQSMII